MQEIWKDIEGYEGFYQVSNFGTIKSLSRYIKFGNKTRYSNERILKFHKDKDGYKKVILQKSGKAQNYLIHRLVAQAFIPNPDNKPQINHKDGDKQNNKVDNLEWCTPSENMIHAFKTELCQPSKPWLREIWEI